MLLFFQAVHLTVCLPFFRDRWDGPAVQSLRGHSIWLPLWSARLWRLQGKPLIKNHVEWFHTNHCVLISFDDFCDILCPRVFSAAASSRTSITRCVWRTRIVWSCAWTATGASIAASRNASLLACQEMVRRPDTFLMRDPHTILSACHSDLISQSSREMGSQNEALCWYVGLCE